MKKLTTFACLAMAMVFALSAMAGDEIERPKVWSQEDARDFRADGFGKAAGDTFLLIGPTGSGAPYVGDWESGATVEDNGWTKVDITKPTESHFKLDTYMQVGGDIAAWSGEMYDRCIGVWPDSVGGYGNNWHDIIEWRHTVANALTNTDVRVQASMQVWTEPDYDFAYQSARRNGVPGYDDGTTLTGWIMATGGFGTLEGPQDIDNTYSYAPGEYLNGNEIAVQFRVTSDGGWSDQLCEHPYGWGAGALQVDDITVTVTEDTGGTPVETVNELTTFNAGGTLGDPNAEPPVASDYSWGVTYPTGVGSFAKVWSGLEDDDPCDVNYTNQVAFIDDGVVVPGTGGSDCITWCYGPSGYVVNHTGGLEGGTSHTHCYAQTPAIPWPDPTHDGLTTWVTVYRHELLAGNSTGVVYRIRMRSADTSLGGTIEDEGYFHSGNWIGGPNYIRSGTNWTTALEPNRDFVQFQLGCYELGWAWEQEGTDGTPAPYHDFFRVITYPISGPAFGFAQNNIGQDGFPAIGAIDYGDLSANSVRFDRGGNISPTVDLRNDPGDSLSITCTAARNGAELVGVPELHWVLLENPTFSGVTRDYPPNPIPGFSPAPDVFVFDAPDTGFLFPGDRLQYYFSATDDLIGGGAPQTNTLPADLDGYGDFSDPLAWDTRFQINCLPTMFSDTPGDNPELFFWNDFGQRGGEDEWFGALTALGLQRGVDYDAYHTNRPDNGAGNGIGAKATPTIMAVYNDMLYTSGDMSYATISNGDKQSDGGEDVQLMDAWLTLGGKDLFMTGDDVAFDLANSGQETQDFLADWVGVVHQEQSLIDFIDGQATPVVLPEPYDPLGLAGQPVFTQAAQWIAYGGCFGINTFDGVIPNAALGTSTRIARFTNEGGVPDYTYSAATLNIDGGTGSRVLSMPYDFIYIYDDPNAKIAAPKAARTLVLSDVLNYFGVSNSPGNVVPVVPGKQFAVFQNAPNPFNPVTSIKYVMPRTGHMTMKVYNVRGQLVKTLVDGTVEATDNGEIIWDGTNNQGGSVSSGVYFYETRTVDGTVVNKMALVK